ncbi:MAG: DMT family transporter [Muribaculaceae bacterium]|nr:DMT family transporter [Muribaculaceae bacterium]
MESEKINPSSGRLLGHVAMLLAAVFWGAMSPIAKHLMLSGAVTPMALSAIRIVGGAIVFWIAGLLFPRKVTGDGRLAKADIAIILLMSVLIISANQGLYIIGIGFTTPFEATVMTTMTPVFTLLLAAIFIAMPMTLLKVTGVALGLGGALLLAFASRDSSTVSMASNPMLGNLMCMGAQICAAVYFTMFRGIISRYHPFTLMKWLFLFGALTWIPFAWSDLMSVDIAMIDGRSIMSLAYIILFPTFFAYLFMLFAQQRLKPTTVSMYSYVQPLTAATLASIMGLAVFGWSNIIATVMIFSGVAMVAFSKGK